MTPVHCTPWSMWDWQQCYHERILNDWLPSICVVISMVCVLVRLARRPTSQPELLPRNKATHAYGTFEPSASTSSDDMEVKEEQAACLDLSGPATWSVYTLGRLTLSAVQAGFCLVAIVQLTNGTYRKDHRVEDDHIQWTYDTRLVYWLYCMTLLVLTYVVNAKMFVRGVLFQLNWLTLVDFGLRCIDVYDFYQIHSTHVAASSGYLFSVWMLVTNSALILVMLTEPPVGAPHGPVLMKSGRVMSGENWASLYSQFMFNWVDVMMKRGWVRTLDDRDMLELPAENRAQQALANYRLHYRLNFAWSVVRAFHRPLIAQFLYSMVWSVAMFGPPFFLNKIVSFIERADPNVPVFTAFLYAFGLFISSCTQSLSYQQALYIGRVMSIRLQAIVIGEVYAKSLRRRDTAGIPEEDLSGNKAKSNVNNLLSVDAQKLGDVIAYVIYFYSFPVQATICVWALYRLLGVSALFGVLVMFMAQPVTLYLSRRFQKVHQRVMACTDKRIKLMSELLNAIRIVKFFAWENEFRQRIQGARKVELKAAKSRLMMFMWMNNAYFLIPVLTMVAVFFSYTRTHILTASISFSALSLFNTFKSIMDQLPAISTFFLQAKVSVGRIESFLHEDDVKSTIVQPTADVSLGLINDASFSWENDAATSPASSGTSTPKIALQNINVSFPLNKLSLICGPTGAGKTTLLMSLLGETRCVSGAAVLPRKHLHQGRTVAGSASGIAYVAQTAWLQNLSIRDNILFGLPFDAERYSKVIYMTALTRDLDMLEHGDRTEVGEKGISLSGGQKQRLAIARAVYSQADILILDDCLSAVDAHTAKHIYQHCLMGDLMKHRTVLLVTHHVGLCIRGADYVVALQDGRVASAGAPEQVIASGALGEDFSVLGESDDQDEASAVPTVPIHAYNNDSDQPDDDAKLTKDEQRSEGGVKFSVYQAYIKASGGYWFWVLILAMFGLSQATIMSQDYWIKVWSAAYANTISNALISLFQQVTLPMSSPSPLSVASAAAQDPVTVNVTYYLTVYVLIGCLALVMTSLRFATLFNASIRASHRLHHQLLDRILHAKLRFFDTTPMGRILNRFSSDMETIDQGVAPNFSFLLYNIVSSVYVVVMITLVTPMFIVPGTLIALMFWQVGRYYLRSSRDMKRLNSVSRSPIYVQFNETIQGVATIRAFGAQQRFIQDNFTKIDTNNRPFLWMWAANRWLQCRVDILGASIGLFTAIVLLLSRAWIDAGLAGLSLAYAITFTQYILWIVRTYAMNEMNCVSIERVEEYMHIDQEQDQGKLARSQWPEAGLVQFKDVEVQYAPDTPVVLHGISFETKPREKIGIVGRTGSGKSTITLALFRFLTMNRGQIMIDGVDISTLSLEELRSRLTIIPQDPVLFSGTLRQNLDPFGEHDDADLYAALKRSHLTNQEQNTPLSLEDPVLENGSNWSHGQRQLIALARALVKKSTVIVMDEATSSVDFETDRKIQETIRSEFGHATILCIAHRIRTVADYDRILVLDAGEIQEFDTSYNLMTKTDGVFKEMCARSGEQQELLAIAKTKHLATSS